MPPRDLRAKVKRVAVLLGVVLVALGPLGVSSAAVAPLAGSVDPSFGFGGVVTHDLGSGEYPRINGIVVQSDGKIVVAGGSTPGDHGLLLARYLPNGSLDPSFGDGGYVETPFTYWAFARAIALQPDGKIVVAGVSYQGNDAVLSEFTLARYNPDGSLDPSFGTDGLTNTVIPEQPNPTPWSSGASAIAILPGGDILAAGSSGWQGGGLHLTCCSFFALVRYTPGGSLDPTFGDGGIVQTSFGLGGGGTLAGIAVQSDGKIVATGTAETIDSTAMMALARYKRDGSLDRTFGTSGKVTTSRKLPYAGGPPALQHGKIVVAGSTRPNSVSNFLPVIARFEANGHLDTTFGVHGFAEITSVIGWPTAVFAQKDGKILFPASGADATPLGPTTVARLRPNGRLDPSFGRGGMVSFGDAASNALALQRDSKVLVGGGHDNTWTLARVIGGNNCVVPRVDGKKISQATTTLKKSYCRRGHISKRFSGKVTRGRVISTTPPRGTRLRGGAKVDLVVSKGKRP